MITKKMYRINKPLFVVFVELKKALVEVSWTIPFTTLENIGVDYNDERIIYNVYDNGIAIIKKNDGKSWIDIHPGQH